MKLRLGTTGAVALASVAGSATLTLAVYERLPARIPTHFDLRGIANAWMAKSTGAWLLPLLALCAWVAVRVLGRFSPATSRDRAAAPVMIVVADLVVALLAALQCIVLYAALERPTSVATPLALLLGASWVALGLLLPRVRRNRWVGVRTPWTLSSDENWARTHRVAGLAFSCGGALAVLLTLAGARAAGLAVIVAVGVVPIAYSYLLAKREPPRA